MANKCVYALWYPYDWLRVNIGLANVRCVSW